MRISTILAAALVCATLPFQPVEASPPDGVPEETTKEERELYDLFAEEWSYRSAELGFSDRGEGPVDYMPQVDARSQLRREAVWAGYLERLGAIDEKRLSDRARVDAAVFRNVLEGFLIEARARSWEMPFNSDTSFWSSLDEGGGWTKAEQYEAYLARLRQLPRYFDQHIENMKLGLARGFSVPRVTLAGRDRSIEAYLTEELEANPYYVPFKDMPEVIQTQEAEALRAEARKVLRDDVVPAYSRLLEFFRNEYLPRAREEISASALPDGPGFYREQVRLYTTLDISPEEVHAIGLREVALLEEEIRERAQAAGIEGSIAEIFARLREDPRFVADSPEDLLMRTAWIAKRVDGRIGDLIGTLPRQRFTVRPVPDEIAPFYTSGRGGREACWMNTYDLPSRPLYALTALTLHECSPGHSLQTAIAAEQDDRPEFRRRVYFSGYSEGWGLYSEWLGVEMGLYDTPYDDLGRLSYAMWRACRLVIDTGIHHYGWSRGQAIDYLTARTGLSSHEIETEIDRYISWPGQALSYKLGELEIRRIRAEAEERLGPRFDPRSFHDAILSLGSVPLSVLSSEMELWIEREATSNEEPGPIS